MTRTPGWYCSMSCATVSRPFSFHSLRVSSQRGLHQSGQSIHAAPHVGDAGGDPDPGSCRQPDHRRRARQSSTVLNVIGSTPPRSRSVTSPITTSIIGSPCLAADGRSLTQDVTTGIKFTGAVRRPVPSKSMSVFNTYRQCRLVVDSGNEAKMPQT